MCLLIKRLTNFTTYWKKLLKIVCIFDSLLSKDSCTTVNTKQKTIRVEHGEDEACFIEGNKKKFSSDPSDEQKQIDVKINDFKPRESDSVLIVLQ